MNDTDNFELQPHIGELVIKYNVRDGDQGRAVSMTTNFPIVDFKDFSRFIAEKIAEYNKKQDEDILIGFEGVIADMKQPKIDIDETDDIMDEFTDEELQQIIKKIFGKDES